MLSGRVYKILQPNLFVVLTSFMLSLISISGGNNVRQLRDKIWKLGTSHTQSKSSLYKKSFSNAL